MNEIDVSKLRAGNFVANNGLVLRTINILRTKYNKLAAIQRVLSESGVSCSEFLDAINFLAEEGYIHLRHIVGHSEAALADVDYKELEAKLTGKGIRLLAGDISDNLVEV